MTRRGVLSAASAAITLFGLLAAGVAPVAVASASGDASANGAVHSKRVCAVAPAGYAACHALVVTDANLNPIATTTNPSGYYPAQLRAAYGLTTDATATVAIVDAYANPNAASDLAVYRSQFSLPSLGSSGGPVLTQVSQTGGPISKVRGNTGWGQEEMLDLEMVSAICPSCNILYVGAKSASFNDLAAAVDRAAATLGVVAISNSYGANEFSGEATIATHYDHPGVAITVSSGDSGYGAQAPAAFKTVTAVGGTTLTLDATKAPRGYGETVWSGAGSGCSIYIGKPTWQTDTGCGTQRTIADVAAVADPNTGVAVYDSYGSRFGVNWYVFGGTSVAAPIIGAVYALSGNTADVPAILAYASGASLFDVTSGSNGNCSVSVAYLCTGGVGYDGPTGNGTPNGARAF